MIVKIHDKFRVFINHQFPVFYYYTSSNQHTAIAQMYQILVSLISSKNIYEEEKKREKLRLSERNSVGLND